MSSTITQHIAAHFGVTTESHPGPLYSIPGKRLLTSEGLKEFVDAYSPLMKALEPAAAGAYIVSRLGGLNIAVQYMISHDTLIDLSPNWWTLQLYKNERGYIEFRFVLEEVLLLSGPDGGARELWREERLSHWYGSIMRPIIENLAKLTRMDTVHLWKLIPMRLRYALDHWKEETTSKELHSRYEEDWEFLSKVLDGDVFGRKRNPLDVTFVKVDYPGALGEADIQYRMKTACCMYYRTEGGQFCYTCPRMKPAERDQRKEEIRAQLAEEARLKAVQ